jgi:hypothetical protein
MKRIMSERISIVKDLLRPGMPLFSNGESFLSNAVVVNVNMDDSYTIMSDFGNIMRFSLEELMSHFNMSNVHAKSPLKSTKLGK